MVEDSVERHLWEPLHEWESRVKFVEDNLDTHGMEKAIHLSILWANMNFLGCRYPARTQALVSHYPLPSMDELRERRSHRPKKRTLEDRNSQDNEGVDGPPDTKKNKPGPSRAEVSALISSIRSETEQNHASSDDDNKSRTTVGELETIASKTCLCEKCLGKVDNATSKAIRILERYSTVCSGPFTHTFTFSESASSHVCGLVINGTVVIERTGSKKKDAKTAAAIELVQRVEEWQEANQLPPCMNVKKQPPPSQPPYGGASQPPYGGASQPPYGGASQPPYGGTRPPYGGTQPPYGGHSQPPYSGSSYQAYSRPKDNSYYMPPPRGRGYHGYRGGYRGGYY